MTTPILSALLKLDIANDNHWTADGLPRLDTVKMLASSATLTREAINAVAPGFTRANAVGYVAPAPVAEAAQQAPQAAQQAEKPVAVVTAVEEAAEPAQADIKTLLEEQVRKVDELRKKKAQLDAEFQAARALEDHYRTQFEATTPVKTTTHDIQDYLAAQRKILEERGMRRQMIKESGIDLKALSENLRAPIDAARKKR